MSIESALFDRLSDAGGGLYALVGTRIHPVRDPQGMDRTRFPCVTWQRIAESRPNAFSSDAGVVDAAFQIDGWATTFDGIRTLSEAIRERMQRWRNPSGTIVQDTFVESVNDEYLDDAEIFRVRFQIRLIYGE